MTVTMILAHSLTKTDMTHDYTHDYAVIGGPK